jgi:hypothetical protein
VHVLALVGQPAARGGARSRVPGLLGIGRTVNAMAQSEHEIIAKIAPAACACRSGQGRGYETTNDDARLHYARVTALARRAGNCSSATSAMSSVLRKRSHSTLMILGHAVHGSAQAAGEEDRQRPVEAAAEGNIGRELLRHRRLVEGFRRRPGRSRTAAPNRRTTFRRRSRGRPGARPRPPPAR